MLFRLEPFAVVAESLNLLTFDFKKHFKNDHTQLMCSTHKHVNKEKVYQLSPIDIVFRWENLWLGQLEETSMLKILQKMFLDFRESRKRNI